MSNFDSLAAVSGAAATSGARRMTPSAAVREKCIAVTIEVEEELGDRESNGRRSGPYIVAGRRKSSFCKLLKICAGTLHGVLLYMLMLDGAQVSWKV